MSSPQKTSYSLALTVNDSGTRSYSATVECKTGDELSEALVWDIVKMISLFDEPPTPSRTVAAMEEGSSPDDILLAIAWLRKFWTAESISFEKAFSVSVDLDVLLKGSKDIGTWHAARRAAEQAGFVVKGKVPEQP